MSTEPPSSPTVDVVQRYLAAVGAGDMATAGALFAPDLVYIAPGRNRLAGVRHGQGGAGEWFGAMGELSGGSYGIANVVDWLASDSHAVLIAREQATIEGRSHEWTRLVDFTVADGLMTRVELFEDDQLAYDAWLGGTPDAEPLPSDDPLPAPGPPAMSGDVEDARVQAIMAYQQQVAAGDLDRAREIFWPDVRYVVPGASQLAGTYDGPDAVMGYFARLAELTDGTYAITRMHWATSADRVALLTRNVAERAGRHLAWDECIVFEFDGGRKRRIHHFHGDQHGADELFG